MYVLHHFGENNISKINYQFFKKAIVFFIFRLLFQKIAKTFMNFEAEVEEYCSSNNLSLTEEGQAGIVNAAKRCSDYGEGLKLTLRRVWLRLRAAKLSQIYESKGEHLGTMLIHLAEGKFSLDNLIFQNSEKLQSSPEQLIVMLLPDYSQELLPKKFEDFLFQILNVVANHHLVDKVKLKELVLTVYPKQGRSHIAKLESAQSYSSANPEEFVFNK